MRCGECVHWGREGDGGEYRPCVAVHHDVDSLADPRYDLEPGDDPAREGRAAEVRSCLAVVQDGSGYFACLKTRECFGCVLFVAREVP